MLDIKSLDRKELESWIQKKGFEPYRGRQIWHWILKKAVSSFEQMSDLPKRLRNLLKEEAELNPLELVKVLESKEDHTKKYLYKRAFISKYASISRNTKKCKRST